MSKNAKMSFIMLLVAKKENSERCSIVFKFWRTHTNLDFHRCFLFFCKNR